MLLEMEAGVTFVISSLQMLLLPFPYTTLDTGKLLISFAAKSFTLYFRVAGKPRFEPNGCTFRNGDVAGDLLLQACAEPRFP